MAEDVPTNPEALAYDLRQRYAKLVGDHIEEVSIHRYNTEWYEWFKSLRNLYTITKHNYKENDKKRNDKTNEQEFEQLVDVIIDKSNLYMGVWNKESNDPRGEAEIDQALRDLEEFIYFKMKECGMFGSKRELTGLM